MVEISEALTKKVAKLARIRLSEEEVQEYTAQLGKVLHYVDLLQEVNVEGVDPQRESLATSAGEPAYRRDEARMLPLGKVGEPKVLESAPETQDGAFQVPQIV